MPVQEAGSLNFALTSCSQQRVHADLEIASSSDLRAPAPPLLRCTCCASSPIGCDAKMYLRESPAAIDEPDRSGRLRVKSGRRAYGASPSVGYVGVGQLLGAGLDMGRPESADMKKGDATERIA